MITQKKNPRHLKFKINWSCSFLFCLIHRPIEIYLYVVIKSWHVKVRNNVKVTFIADKIRKTRLKIWNSFLSMEREDTQMYE